jgi:hypothetical protein
MYRTCMTLRQSEEKLEDLIGALYDLAQMGRFSPEIKAQLREAIIALDAIPYCEAKRT